MCGIAGVWHRDGAPVDPARLQAMTDAMAHRGRDDEGLWIRGSLGFGHRRLSIIDRSPAGHQPMHAPEHGLTVVFNGEIHNYLELREELAARGHVFRTATDTEVVLAAWAEWGAEAFERFNGMWAIALWNERAGELVLARDRFGIKPLVVAQVGAALFFASEAKALLAYAPALRRANGRAMFSYLAASMTDIGTETFFRDIHTVPPGHHLVITRAAVATRPSWRFQPGRETPRPDAVEQFRHLLSDAVRLRLRSEAPLGVWLSGGLDSSVIAALAARHADRPVRCYSVRYTEHPRFNESEYASAVAGNTDNLSIEWIDPPSTGLVATIGDIVQAHDAPTVVRGRYACWTISRATARETAVALSGDGADELLGGYQTFAAPYALDRFLRPPPGTSRSWKTCRDEFLAVCDVAAPGLRPRDVVLHAVRCRLGILPMPLHPVVTREFARAYGPVNAAHHFSGWASWCGQKPYAGFLNNALWREFRWRGLPEMMKGFDACTMAHTLELRSPFLDHRLVEFCFSLPYHEKIRDGVTKRLLRDGCADLLPPVVRNRRRKLGFPSPLYFWFGQPENLQPANDLLRGGEGIRCGIFDRQRLHHALDHLATHDALANTPRQELLWTWLALEHWLRRYQATL